MGVTAIRIVGCLWASPVTLVGALLLPLYWPRSVRWREGALDVVVSRLVPRWTAAQTFGWLICYRGETVAQRPSLRLHERVHVRQCQLLGPLMLVLYPLASLWAWIAGGHYYRDNLFERWARGELA